MFQTRRPAGRIFYLVLAVVVAASGSRLYAAPQSGPALTSVVDTVYRADGSEAQGTLVITWPAFVSSTTVQVDAGMAPGRESNAATVARITKVPMPRPCGLAVFL